MAYSAIVGSFNIDPTKLATETQAITGLGFQPKIVLFWWGGSTATIDTVAGGTINVGFGAAISSTSRFCVQNISIDAGASSDSQFSQNITEIMRAYTDVTTLDGILDFSSMDADGFNPADSIRSLTNVHVLPTGSAVNGMGVFVGGLPKRWWSSTSIKSASSSAPMACDNSL